ncbi:hypothetical protein ACTNDY_00610 [Tissierellaceae bacterium HCP3S3_D8]
MKSKIISMVLIILILTLIMTGCGNSNSKDMDSQAEIKAKDEKISELENRIKELETDIDNEVSLSNSLMVHAINTMEVIKNRDMDKLSTVVHPTKGIRFTPYPYVEIDSDQIFQREQLTSALKSSQTYTWGNYDGSGEPIKLTFKDYYDRFVYDEDFANPQLIGNNIIVGQGNTEENVVKAYPNGKFIEFYFSGFKSEYGGADWRSLKLVFEQEEGTWYLVGIIHGEWTI